MNGQPLREPREGFAFLWQDKVVGAVVAVGTLQTLLGAMLGAFTSGWVGGLRRPGAMLLGCVITSSLAIAALGLFSHIAGALVALVVLGYFGSIASPLQFTLVQGHTPDRLLGRVNSLLNAQDVTGDALGALGIGALARAIAPLAAVLSFGFCAAGLGVLMASGFSSLRRLAGTTATGEADAPLESAPG